MRAGNRFGQTLREAPAEAQIPSHKLLVRGAFIRQVAAGIYTWLPLGYRVLMNVAQIVREEMDRQGAVELLMPTLHPAELWQRSGRWDTVDVLYRLQDRSGRDFCLAPTHEEIITTLAASELPSYKDLPSIPYHIQWKFRDEPRARGGLLRGREFLMKDAYSFDADEEGLKASYDKMAEAYRRSFERCGLQARMIEAQAGMIGGTVNNEFIQPADNGEDTFVACTNCDYAANTEVAASRPAAPYDFGEAAASPVKVLTPGLVTVDEVAAFLGVERRQLAKALVYRTGDDLVCALVPGDRELNEYKLGRVLGGAEVRMLTDDEFATAGIVKGFAGPVGAGVRLVADRSLRGARNLVTGANETDHHLTGVVPGRDFEPDDWADLVVAAGGDVCERCGGPLEMARGIEVGHIFQLVGAGYIARLGATFTAEDGARRPFVMGCYGLGVSRVVAAVVEAHHDERGIQWPRALAPYEVVILLLAKDGAAREAAEALHDELGDRAVLDDRDVSPGVKFADADLIGYPLQVVVGKTFAASGRLEAKIRATGERTEIGSAAHDILEALAQAP
jgi:prolyl-tRNA synthetase